MIVQMLRRASRYIRSDQLHLGNLNSRTTKAINITINDNCTRKPEIVRNVNRLFTQRPHNRNNGIDSFFFKVLIGKVHQPLPLLLYLPPPPMCFNTSKPICPAVCQKPGLSVSSCPWARAPTIKTINKTVKMTSHDSGCNTLELV